MSKKSKEQHVTQDDTQKKGIEEIKSEDIVSDKSSDVEQKKTGKNISIASIGTVSLAAVKVVLPVVAMLVVIAIIVSLVKTRNEKKEEVVAMTEATTEETTIVEPLEVDAYQVINDLMEAYYAALSSGDMTTVSSLMDDISEVELVELKNKNSFVRSYEDITCYTRKGPEQDSFFVYVTYQAKFIDFDVKVPGVTTHYVYKDDEGNYKIAKEMTDEINEARIESTSQDDVIDIFNKIDVEYKEILAANEDLNNFMTEITIDAKTKTGEELAMLEAGEEVSTEAAEAVAMDEPEQTVVSDQPQSQTVDEDVKTTATVNVRSSDSENADKVGKVSVGTTLKRTEVKINGWSKVIYEGKEAYIKSDYLEVISSTQVEETTNEEQNTARTEETSTATNSNPSTSAKQNVTAKTNVNVRNKPSTESDIIGKANGGTSYKVIEDQGEWLKIEFKGQTGYVKSEFFD